MLIRPFVLFFLLLLIASCQPKVYLMPAPVLVAEDSSYFDWTQGNKDGNLLYTLYATNRQPFDHPSGSTRYTIFPSDDLTLGFVAHSVGIQPTDWETLKSKSVTDVDRKDLLLRLVHVRPRAEYLAGEDLSTTSARGEGYFERINSWLDKAFDQDLLVYVHGANSNFYRATAQGAQTYHYTGHNTVLLTFSWPSAENLLKYQTDVLHAKKSVAVFANLLEVLANHTKARNINILSYSAGAQVTVPGLALLRERYPELSDEQLRRKFRLGEVYLAAPDLDFSAFTDNYLKFRGIVTRTTINLNHYDSVLRLAAFQNGVSRLGRPDFRDINETEARVLLEATKTPQLDILNVGDSKGLKLGGDHDSWYSHPWVSNDLILLLLFNANPDERGLVRQTGEHGAPIYYFPEDYDQRILEIIRSHNQILQKQNPFAKGTTWGAPQNVAP